MSFPPSAPVLYDVYIACVAIGYVLCLCEGVPVGGKYNRVIVLKYLIYRYIYVDFPIT